MSQPAASTEAEPSHREKESAPGELLAPGRAPTGLTGLAAEAAQLRLKVLALAAENERLRDTVSYQLGNMILRAKTWRGAMALPVELFRLAEHSRKLRGKGKGRLRYDAVVAERIERLTARALDMSAEEVARTAIRECKDNDLAVRLLADLAVSLQPVDFAKSVALARQTVVIDGSPRRMLWLAGFLYDGGMIEEPRELYNRVSRSKAPMSAVVRQRREVLEGLARVRDHGLPIPPRRQIRRVEDRSLMYVAASSFPYHVTGYAARTHSLVKAIANEGWRVEAVTRPGYPQDRNDIHIGGGDVGAREVDGVIYNRLTGPPSNTTPFDHYCERAAASLYEHIQRSKPALVHAASNYVNAAPALMAARKAGLPFVYEVRGLWELTNAARVNHWDGSERFLQQRAQETTVAREADAVVAISQGLKDELVTRGVDRRKIIVVPNSVDTKMFSPRAKDRRLSEELGLGDRRVLGFLGSMTGYEGLVDLISALVRVRASGLDACALLVGDGPAFREVREAARSLGMLDHLIMPGRVPHLETPRWYSVMDVACYPRRPARVTELVPPLKPLEAMSMELPVVASDVSAISETVVNGQNGYLFPKGDVRGLADLIESVLNTPQKSLKVGRQARQDVERRFTWSRAAGQMGDVYQQFS